MKNKLKENWKDVVVMICLVMFGVLTRTIFHLGVNIEFVTGISLLAGYIFKKRAESIVVTVFIMVVSDVILGNSIIFLFTWSGFLVAPLLGTVLKKFNSGDYMKIVFSAQVLSVFSTLVFFSWTNFGVVVTTQMYTRNVQGLVQSYMNALPFLKNQLLGNLILVPVIFIVYFVAKKISILNSRNQWVDNNKLSQI